MDSKEDVLKNEEGRMDSKEDVLKNEEIEQGTVSAEAVIKERLNGISNSIKAVGALTGAGISYCIVIPGKGTGEDWRLASCCLAPPAERTDTEIVLELTSNIGCLLEGFLKSLRDAGMDDEAVRGLLDTLVSEVKAKYEDRERS